MNSEDFKKEVIEIWERIENPDGNRHFLVISFVGFQLRGLHKAFMLDSVPIIIFSKLTRHTNSKIR